MFYFVFAKYFKFIFVNCNHWEDMKTWLSCEKLTFLKFSEIIVSDKRFQSMGVMEYRDFVDYLPAHYCEEGKLLER